MAAGLGAAAADLSERYVREWA
ncbi:hypothetical protein [Agrobacterium tumefaciens]